MHSLLELEIYKVFPALSLLLFLVSFSIKSKNTFLNFDTKIELVGDVLLKEKKSTHREKVDWIFLYKTENEFHFSRKFIHF